MARAARMAAQKRSNSPRRRARADFFCRHRAGDISKRLLEKIRRTEAAAG